MKPERLREILSKNIKVERKKLGLTQEKLAEMAELSAQTVNDIEGCRMWVSDKTITKLAKILHMEVYQLLIPIAPSEPPIIEATERNQQLIELEDRIIRNIRQQFKGVLEITDDT